MFCALVSAVLWFICGEIFNVVSLIYMYNIYFYLIKRLGLFYFFNYDNGMSRVALHVCII